MLKFRKESRYEEEEDDAMFESNEKSSINATNNNGIFTYNASMKLNLVVRSPRKYTDAAEIADLYKKKNTVILVFANTNKDVANRLIDFFGGATYITDGEIKRISDTTYVLAPFNVEVTGDLIEEITSISGGDDHNSFADLD